MANPAPTINQINAFNATQGTIIDFNIIGGTELVRSNRIYIYDLSDNSLICTHLYVSTESIHELPANTDSSIVYESGKSSADFVNGAQYYAQIQTYTDTAGTEGGSGLSVAKMFWCLVDPTLTITTIPSTISTTSYNVSATYDANTSVVSNIIQQYQFNLYSATGSLLQSSGVIVGSGTQQGTSTAYDISYNFTGLSVGSSYYVVVDVTTTQGMSVSTQSNTFTVSIETPTLGEATVVNNACDGYISVTSNLSGEYGGSASGEIATFETDSVNDVSSIKVTLTPQQDGTPWIGTTHDTAPYLNRAMPSQSNSYNRESGVIVGGTVAWNQLVQRLRGGVTINGITITPNEDMTLTVNGTATENVATPIIDGVFPADIKSHRFLITESTKVTGGGTNWFFYNGYAQNGRAYEDKGGGIVTHNGTADWTSTLYMYIGNGITINNVKLKINVFDLTAMFGSAIADYIYSLEQATAGAGVAWFRRYFPEDYYPYSQPTLQSVQATAHKTYDGDGNVIGNYALDSSLTLRGIPKLDASNNLYYDGDTYESDGTVTRKYGIVDLGTLNYTRMQIGSYYYFKSPIHLDNAINYKENTGKLLTSKYTTLNYGAIITDSNFPNMGISGSTIGGGGGYFYIRDDNYTDAATFKAAMSGVYLVYELATPTTETADPYTNPQVVDLDGTEEYVTANYVPVGHDSTYSLVCPISGYDSVSANVTGINMWDEEWELGSISNANGMNVNNNTAIRSTNFIPVNPSTAYFFKSPSTIGLRLYGKDKEYINSTVQTNLVYTIPSDVYYVRFTLPNVTTYNNDISINYPSTDTSYHPYQGRVDVTAEFENTVYGGTVDLVSGVLTVDNGKKIETTADVSLVSTQYTNIVYARFEKPSDSSDKGKGTTNILCSHFVVDTATTNLDDSGKIGHILGGAAYNYYWVGFPIGTTLAQAQSAINGSELVYELATPQTYQLTPQEIQTLVGTNNVWSDSGDVEITYNIPITNLLVKRQDVADVSGTWLTLYSQPVTQASDMDFTFIDFLNQYGKTYKYALVPLLTQTQSGVEVEVEGGYTVSDEVQSIFDGVFIADATELQKCKANVGYGDVDMNQAVGTITPIGSKYPVVITNSKNQYHNGSITGTIVPDDYYSNGNLSRIDMVNKRNELEQFLTNKRAKIIKDWNGNTWLVMIMDNINCTFNNEYGMGIVNFTANWIEVGDPTNQQDLQATGLIDVGGA